jgi:PAS domain S-box-containing protein
MPEASMVSGDKIMKGKPELEQELGKLKHGDHICLIYENPAEQLAVAVPFIRDGLDRGERCLYIADDCIIDEVVQALVAAGVDVAQKRERGALRFVTSQDTYFRTGEFDPQTMLNLIRQAETEALRDGFSGLRLTGEPTWSFGPEPGCDRLIEYEALLNHCPRFSKSVVLCQYNHSRFGVPCIHDVLRTHPVAILGDQVCPNPYYELPELVLRKDQPGMTPELRAKRVDWWIAQLKQARAAEQERERAETALRESEGRFREIVELMPAAVYVCDKNGMIQQSNRRAAELWGRESRSGEDVRFCGAIRHFRTDGSLIPRDELPIVETIRNGTPVRNREVVIERADGSRVVVIVNIAPIRNAEGAPVGAINCFLDVTDRRQAEERLRQSERRLAEAQQVAHIGSWERDLLTNQVTWSDELYHIFGLKAGEIVLSYQQFLNLLVPQDVDRMCAVVDEAIRERRHFNCDYRITLADGSIRVLNDRGGTILNEQGEPIRLVGTCQDVTELRKAEQALQEHAARLQTLSRRLLEVQEEERRHLARELHDEVGQMLTGLRLILKPTADFTTNAARTGFEKARALVDELLETVRQLSFDLRPAALDQLGLLPGLLALFERYTRQTGVVVNFKHQGVNGRFAPEVETTAYRIVQEALTNVARHAAVANVSVRVWTIADMLSAQIEDRGRGFSAEDALARLRSSGLPGMQERVTLLGGRLTIESRPGTGTQITAELPLHGSNPQTMEAGRWASR